VLHLSAVFYFLINFIGFGNGGTTFTFGGNQGGGFEDFLGGGGGFPGGFQSGFPGGRSGQQQKKSNQGNRKK